MPYQNDILHRYMYEFTQENPLESASYKDFRDFGRFWPYWIDIFFIAENGFISTFLEHWSFLTVLKPRFDSSFYEQDTSDNSSE